MLRPPGREADPYIGEIGLPHVAPPSAARFAPLAPPVRAVLGSVRTLAARFPTAHPHRMQTARQGLDRWRLRDNPAIFHGGVCPLPGLTSLQSSASIRAP